MGEEVRVRFDRIGQHIPQKDILANSCDGEVGKGGIRENITIPPHQANEMAKRFWFSYENDGELLILEEDSRIESLWKRIQEQKEHIDSAPLALLEILAAFAREDVLYLQHLEKELGKMEETLMTGHEVPFSEQFLRYRRRLSELHFHYEQMIDLGEVLMAEYGRIEWDLLRQEWQQYVNQVERLDDYVGYMREYITQLRDLYHTIEDDRKNNGIRFLTVITTLCLPLTILTGWYGMNFKYMPEIHWKYGYPVFIAVVALIILVELWGIRKSAMVRGDRYGESRKRKRFRKKGYRNEIGA